MGDTRSRSAAGSVGDACAWADAGRAVELFDRLRGSATIPDMLAATAGEALRGLPFTRAVVLTVSAGGLTVKDSGVLGDDASDRLRRSVASEPVQVPDAGGGRWPERARAALTQRLDLRNPAIGAVGPTASPFAVLVCDRDAPGVGEDDERAVTTFAATVGIALEHAILRRRSSEISEELRHLMTSASALLNELLRAPLVLPSVEGTRGALPWTAVGADDARALRELLSQREVDILKHLVAGRSNREIAGALMLAPDTVKGHVARVLRKLGVHNRVEAVSAYLALDASSRS